MSCLIAESYPALLWPHRLQLSSLLCPWDFPGKNTGVSCHFLLQGIFLTQGSNMSLLHWQADSLPLSHQGSPVLNFKWNWVKQKSLENYCSDILFRIFTSAYSLLTYYFINFQHSARIFNLLLKFSIQLNVEIHCYKNTFVLYTFVFYFCDLWLLMKKKILFKTAKDRSCGLQFDFH